MKSVRLVMVLALAGLALPAFAHHSFAMFDRDKEVTLVGTVREFQWTNPHAFIEMDVPDDSGTIQKWSIELNSPNNLTRQGWKSSMLKPGDKISVTMNPLRDGKKGGLFVSVVLPDGKVIKDPTRRQLPPPEPPKT
ncbi:MAG TPA: DUF6152 family protein [Steroidobacteraceae bacterium]|jgi:hypothetical protein|nr:DUF6152 family protein [Steroidobacteraceae bacterium]